jgi:hypothetical protein
MRHSLKAATALLPLLLALSACGKSEQPAAPGNEGSGASAPISETPAVLPPAAVDDEVVVYDPIDASKLSNTWWEQYNKGG